jgi:thioredoxin reductase (NADPH)
MINPKILSIVFLLNFTYLNSEIHKIVIIGGGPSAYSAAVSAGNGKLKPVVIEGHEPGGQPVKAGDIKNYPGMKSINGGELVSNIKEHAEHLGTKVIEEKVISVNFKKTPFTITTDKNQIIQTHTVIISTGSEPIKLNCPGENKCWGRGVVVCAKCDGHLFKDKEVVIVGGGYSALREVGNMKQHTSKITIVNPNKKLSAPQFLINGAKGITTLNNYSVVKIINKNNEVTGIEIKNKDTGKTMTLPAQGILVGLGWKPSSKVFKDQLDINSKDQIIVTNDTETSIPGVFAAGDVTSKSRHQLFMAASQGFAAAMDAETYLKKNGKI